VTSDPRPPGSWTHGARDEAAEILCILDDDGTRTHLGPGGPFPETGPEEA
jgi:hypothetical protein